MSSKKLSLYILISLGSALGGWISTLFGATAFSGLYFLFGVIGMTFGIYIWIKMGQ